MRERELGPDHLEVAASLNNLAVLLKTTGANEEAETLLQRSIRIKETALGPKHPQVLLHPLQSSCAFVSSQSDNSVPCWTGTASRRRRHTCMANTRFAATLFTRCAALRQQNG